MSEWNVCCIDDLGTVNRGKSKHRPRNDSILFGGLYPFIQTADVKKANLYITEYNETYSDIGLAQSKLWDKGTLCITIAANIAESAILGIDACFPDSVVGFIPHKGKSDLKFVKYLLDEFKVYMQQISKGTTQDNLSLEKLRRVKFNVPEYNTQVKIANFLSTYDDLIENNQRRIALLEKAAQELYKEWFVRFRFPGYENAKFENGLPKGWKIKKVKDIVKRFPFGKLYKEADVLSEGQVIVIDQSKEPYIGFHNDEPSHTANIDTPIILFGDHSCKLQLMITPFSLSENVVPFSAIKDIDTTYLYFLVKDLIETTEYKRHWTEFVSKKVLLADYDIQKQFSETIKSNLLIIESLKNKNRNLIKQRDLLLPRLMSGKLEV